MRSDVTDLCGSTIAELPFFSAGIRKNLCHLGSKILNADNADVTDLRGFMVAELAFNLRVST